MYFLTLSTLSTDCMEYIFSVRNDIQELIEAFYDENAPTFLPEIEVAKQYNDYIGYVIFERVESDLEMLRVMSLQEEEYSDSESE